MRIYVSVCLDMYIYVQFLVLSIRLSVRTGACMLLLICLSTHVHVAMYLSPRFYQSVCLYYELRMYVYIISLSAHAHSCFYHFSTSLNMHMYAQKSPLTPILSYLEVHIFFWIFIFVYMRRKGSRKSAQGYLSLLCSKMQHISKSHDIVQSLMSLCCSRGKCYNIFIAHLSNHVLVFVGYFIAVGVIARMCS